MQARASQDQVLAGVAERSVAAVMREAVDLDRQPVLGAIEIERVGVAAVLAAKLQSVGTETEVLPKQNFGQRHGLPQFAGAAAGPSVSRWRGCHLPSELGRILTLMFLTILPNSLGRWPAQQVGGSSTHRPVPSGMH